jgi:5-methylcytosine-specific restriction endonuclease McrA
MRRRRRRPRLISDRAWWAAYSRYLEGPVWQSRRRAVLERCGWICVHCGARAVQVHHLRYPRGCRPGSRSWLVQETADSLQAVCLGCHGRLHDQL